MLDNPKSTPYSSLPLIDIVLLCAGPCDNEAWDEFVSRVTQPLSLTIMRTASTWGRPLRALVEDLIHWALLMPLISATLPAMERKLYLGGKVSLGCSWFARCEQVKCGRVGAA
jgi:hypothetical protein